MEDAVVDEMYTGITPNSKVYFKNKICNTKTNILEKIKVTYNQTGKSFLAHVAKLSQETGKQLTWKDICYGSNVLYESSSGKTFDVTIAKVILQIILQLFWFTL